LPKELLWDVSECDVSWEEHREFIIRRTLSRGSWDQIRSLRRQVGDEALREYLTHTHGRALSPRQLRYWETILGLDHDQVSEWLADERRQVWDHR
jgi:hypothetical protein